MSEERFHLAGSLEEKVAVIYVSDRQGFSIITVEVRGWRFRLQADSDSQIHTYTPSKRGQGQNQKVQEQA